MTGPGRARRLPLVFLLAAAVIVGQWQVSSRLGGRDGGRPIEGPWQAAGMKTTDEVLGIWQDKVRANPADFISLTYLGEAYVRKARESGDVTLYQEAQAVAERAVGLRSDYGPAVALLGAIRQSQHDFRGALALVPRLRAADPTSPQALVLLGDAHLELGGYAEARQAYEELNRLRPGPAVISRLARLAWLEGRTPEALTLARAAVDQGAATALTPAEAVAYRLQLGGYLFDSGQVKAADAEYKESLRIVPTSYLALAGRGRARAAQGDVKGAIALYRRAVDLVPDLELAAALGDLYALAGRDEEAQQQYDTAEDIVRSAGPNQALYRRELAMFYANHDRNLDQALELASQEVEARTDVHTYDTLAWSLFRNGRLTEAAEASQRALALGTPDAGFLYHAGMIQDALGHRDRARDLLGRALSVNRHFDPLQARTAERTLSRLQGR